MSRKPFPKVESGYVFPRLELEVLEFWRHNDIFRRSLERNQGGPEFIFYEGPPTANNVPHVGHVVTRVVKDLIPRYRTMRGDVVARKGGWDTHGLPVEIEIEKQLGFTHKAQIEDYGIAEFNRRCLESVHKYELEWRQVVERIGHWIDLDDAYLTYTNAYIESVWWALAELAKQDKLDRGYKIQPYCGRCGTSLSSHEVAQNYKDTDDPSVWVLFPLRPGQQRTDDAGRDWDLGPQVQLVAWTTTPWTLLSHAGLAVNPALRYRLVRHPTAGGTQLVIAEELEKEVPLVVEGDDGAHTKVDLRSLDTVVSFSGESLVGLRYERPFRVALPADAAGGEQAASDDNGWPVLPAAYVTASEGTGIVHTAPLFGEDDYRTGLEYELPQIRAIDEQGKVDDQDGLEDFAGLWFKDADAPIVRDLRSRGRLLHHETHRHSYPFCWRCDRPLLYYATSSWFIRTTTVQDQLIERNRQIHWRPTHIGDGRFGDWLEKLVDWALSRSRYWGTPLPIWLCDACDARRVIGSYSELFEAAGQAPPTDLYDPTIFDPHRPAIDEFSWPCSECDDGTMQRVEEVIDTWFDSGSMPFAQLHYPFENRELFHRRFPADFISEAVDQTRGWFFTLHVLATLLFDDVAFKNCVVLGHVNDEQGRKMSKRLGNVVDPMEVMEESGADALRWYFCLNNPELPARFSPRLVREASQNFLLPLWNALSFLSIYANLDQWSPGAGEPDFDSRPSLDRWILLRLNRLVRDSTEALDDYRISDASRQIESFLGNLTNWYIRRSRDRFWAPADQAPADDKESAYQALYEVLTTIARLLAPFTPFVAEMIYDRLVKSQAPDAPISVHLRSWPEPHEERQDDGLENSIAAVQRIVRHGHAARNAHGIRTRQPLRAVTVVTADPSIAAAVTPYSYLIREELNIHRLEWAKTRSDYVHHEVVPVFPKCGPRFGQQMPRVKAALQQADGDQLAATLAREDRIVIDLDGEPTTLSSEEVELRLIERDGMAVQGDGELLVALDIELDDELVSEGLAREVVHRLQNARKKADLDYADRIRVSFQAAEALRPAIEKHRQWIAAETLAVEITAVDEAEPADLASSPVEGHDFRFRIDRVEESA